MQDPRRFNTKAWRRPGSPPPPWRWASALRTPAVLSLDPARDKAMAH